MPIDFARHKFSPVIALPADYVVFDFSRDVTFDPFRVTTSIFSIGKYNEKRPAVYTTRLFTAGQRDIHMGIDIGAPVGTTVHAFYDGTIFMQGFNPEPGDYGYTIITRHVLDETELFALHGHLSKNSISLRNEGDPIHAGDVIAHLGEREENGGWNPHLHFQLSYERPTKPDLPGVVSEADRERALAIYPDPQLVLGRLY
jgi:peptidoglycan LD-endopeptidase LytH